ncbi:MAG: LysR family transcriptional regulator [Hungatella sp.]|jgi:DNA-binding transcriptional LysR family regulator|nr:LysR family transcriptional regulator [Hungatella sp.]MCI9501128.1 LysR family transcriptional regulator [Hungatella sp.]MCI9635886.1 LysR family transcriptional regulator [Hungatella sp.]
MNIKDYRYIVEIAEQESISKAAAVLYITQSALTKFLQRIEEELGAPLFFRRGNRLALTEIGQYYVAKGRRIIELDYELELDISKMIEKKNKYIRLGYSMGRGDYITEMVLAPFLKQNPGVQVLVLMGSTASRLRLVEKNELDLAIVTTKEYRPGIVYHLLGESPLVLAIPRNSHVLSKGKRIDGRPFPVIESADWIHEPFIQLSSVTHSGKLSREFFKKSGLKPRICMEVNDVRSCMKAVESGIGNCIFWAVPGTRDKMEYMLMEELNPPPQKLFMAYRSDFCVSPAIKQLIQLFEETFKKEFCEY